MTTPKMFKPLELATLASEADGVAKYEIPASVLYPAVLDAIESGAKPTPPIMDEDAPGYDDEAAADVAKYKGLLARARSLTSGLAAARKPPEDAMLTDVRGERAEVLEIARQWFTNELHRAAWTERQQPSIVLGIRCDVDEKGKGLPSPWRL